MSAHSSSATVTVGSIAAAATTGALFAFGHRLGSAGLPFAAISALLFQRSSLSGAAGLVFTGVILHVVAMYVWSALCLWLAGHVREWLAAALVAAAHFCLTWLVAWATAYGVASQLPLGDRIVLALILACALVVGMRFAFFPLRNARDAGMA